VLERYLPTPQSIQWDDLDEVEYFPSAQARQIEAPAREYSPGTQSVQVDEKVAPSSGLILPVGQSIQSSSEEESAPVPYLPAAQLEQAEARSTE